MRTKIALAAFLLSVSVHAQQPAVPRMTYFNGTLKDAGGNPQTGAIRVTFSLYENPEGGAALWSETQDAQLDDQGRYTVLLGATQPAGMPLDIFASGKARWLGVEPQGGIPVPRALLVGVPYALKAADADTLGGLPPSAFLAAAAAMPAGATAVGQAPQTTAAPGAACGSITSDGTATASQVAKFTGGCVIEPSAISEADGKVGIGTAPPASATLAVKGATALAGALNISTTGAATASTGRSSYPMVFNASTYNSSTSAPISQVFQWLAQPVGNDTAAASAAMDLLYGEGGAVPANTGFSIGGNGVVNFAPGQTFPGTGAGTITGITAGSGLSGGGTSGNVTLTNTGLLTLYPANGILSSGGNSPSISLNTNYTNTLYLQLTGGELTGNLGIGQTTPYTQLHIRKDSGSHLGPSLLLMNAAGGSGAGGSVDFDGYDPGSTNPPAGRIQSLDDGNYSAQLTFQTKLPGGASNALQEHMRITDVGQVGIGTTTPSNQLEVWAQSYSRAIFANGYQSPSGSGLTGAHAILSYGGNGDPQNQYTAGGAAISAVGGVGPYADGPGGLFTGGYGVGGGDGIDVYYGSSGYAAVLTGNVEIVDGILSAPLKEFKIDHPQDPANKYLVHASIESSEMMNVYSGNVTTDAGGVSAIQLPDWFETLNTDFRYQLTVIGQFAQAIVSSEIQGNRFEIKTSVPNVKVSWQVSAVRQDPWARAHPLVVEPEKEERQRGFYLSPELYGAPEQKQIEWARHPQIMKEVQEHRQVQAARTAAIK
jgi:trimeric autotransporter adhesin